MGKKYYDFRAPHDLESYLYHRAYKRLLKDPCGEVAKEQPKGYCKACGYKIEEN